MFLEGIDGLVGGCVADGFFMLVRSSNPHASITLTAAYRLISPPILLSCTINSVTFLRRHTIGPVSSTIRVTILRSSQISGSGRVGVVLAGVGFVGLGVVLRHRHSQPL